MGKIRKMPIKKEKEEMDPEKIMDDLSKELNSALKGMSKAKTIEEKVAYSQVVKNLCESLGVFLSLANDIMGLNLDDDY